MPKQRYYRNEYWCCRFPRDDRRAAWLKACKLTNPIPATAYLCNLHFETDQFVNLPETGGRALLKKTAIPTVFPDRSDDNNTTSSHPQSKLQDENNTPIMDSPQDIPMLEEKATAVENDPRPSTPILDPKTPSGNYPIFG